MPTKNTAKRFLKSLHIPLTETQKTKLLKGAKTYSLPLSTYARGVLFGKIGPKH